MYYLNLNQDNSYYLRVNLFLKITVTIAAPQIAITKTFIAILAVSPVLGASVFVVFLSAVSTFLFVLSFVLLLSFSTAGFTGVGFTGVGFTGVVGSGVGVGSGSGAGSGWLRIMI